MVATPSTMLPLGTPAPDFELFDTCSQKNFSLQDLKSDIATVVMFLCNHCPYVKHIQHKLIEIAKIYQQQGVNFIAINSNDAKNYPSDSPEKMQIEAQTKEFTFPYLFDETQDTARAYHAACTPDFFVFDKTLACVYRGRFDAATPGNTEPVTGKELTAALDAILAGKAVNPEQKPSIGCNIKWKSSLR